MQSTQFKDLGRSSDFFLANALLIFRSFFVLKIIADVICRNHPKKMISLHTKGNNSTGRSFRSFHAEC